MERRREADQIGMSPEEVQVQMQMVFEILRRHLLPERLQAFSEDLNALLEDASG